MKHHYSIMPDQCPCAECSEARFRATSERIIRAQRIRITNAHNNFLTFYQPKEQPMTTFFAARKVNYFDKVSRKYPAWCAPSDTAQGAIAACSAEVANTDSPKEIWEMRLVGRVEPAPKPQPTFVPAEPKPERSDNAVFDALQRWVRKTLHSYSGGQPVTSLEISPGDYEALLRYASGRGSSTEKIALLGVRMWPSSRIGDIEL
jgi:hypothetical protein